MEVKRLRTLALKVFKTLNNMKEICHEGNISKDSLHDA